MAAISDEKLSGHGNISTPFEYVYPSSPDKLKIFTKHGLLSRSKTPAVRYLEHMLTKTTLTTQKVSHSNVEGKFEIVLLFTLWLCLNPYCSFILCYLTCFFICCMYHYTRKNFEWVYNGN